MEDLLKAFIDFLTDFFAALAEFLGGSFKFGDILDDIQGAFGDEGTTAAAE